MRGVAAPVNNVCSGRRPCHPMNVYNPWERVPRWPASPQGQSPQPRPDQRKSLILRAAQALDLLRATRLSHVKAQGGITLSQGAASPLQSPCPGYSNTPKSTPLPFKYILTASVSKSLYSFISAKEKKLVSREK